LSEMHELDPMKGAVKHGYALALMVFVVGFLLAIPFVLITPLEPVAAVALGVYLIGVMIVGLLITLRHAITARFAEVVEMMNERLPGRPVLCDDAAVVDLHPLYVVLPRGDVYMMYFIAVTGEMATTVEPSDYVLSVERDFPPEPIEVAGYAVYKSSGIVRFVRGNCTPVRAPGMMYAVVLYRDDTIRSLYTNLAVPSKEEMAEILSQLRVDAGIP